MEFGGTGFGLSPLPREECPARTAAGLRHRESAFGVPSASFHVLSTRLLPAPSPTRRAIVSGLR